MRRHHVDWYGAVVPSLLAALTTWVAMWAWAGFVTRPSSYLTPALVVALLVGATGAVLRMFRVPSLLVLAAQVVVVAGWLTHSWAPEEALGGWVPTGASIEQSLAVLREGVAAAQSYAAPVPGSVPEIVPMLVATGALVALLVDFLACGLRRVPVAGLPLLAVYTAPVSILDDGVPWWAFAAGAIGFLALLVTEESRRLEHWGRQVSRGGPGIDGGDGRVGAVSLRISARRIGLTATTLAVVAPVVIPTLGGSLLSGSGTGGDGDGNAVTLTNPMVNLRRDLDRGRDVDLLTITSPDASPSYLRIAVLDSYTGLAWKPSDRDIPVEQKADGLLPRPPGLDSDVARRRVDYRIEVEDSFDSTWLPTPYPVTTIAVPGDWRYDTRTLDFISAVDGQTTAGMEYSLTSLEVMPSADNLLDAGSSPESIFTPFTALPEDLPPIVRSLARDVTAGLDTRFEKAVRLQRWFREDGDFTYTLEQDPGTGNDDLEAFLTDGPGGREGYCEQFAASMALMGRTLGIPSRVAVGFLRPDPVGDNRYVYSAHDLHAWPEMYFDGVGWVRFEPTPDDRAEGIPGYTTGSFNSPEPTALPSASAPTNTPQRTDRSRLEGDAVATGSEDPGAAGRRIGTGVIAGLVLVLLLVAPWLTRTLVRRRRWATAIDEVDAAEAGWSELRDTALDLRLPWEDSVTLRTRSRVLATSFGQPGVEQREGHVRGTRGVSANPQASQALDRIVRDVEIARYSRDTSERVGRRLDEVRADVDTCVEALMAGAFKKRRRLARWLPASLVRNGAWRSLLPARTPGPLVEAGVDRAV